MEKLDVYEFGKRLLETKDLDPVYVLLWEAKFPKEILKKWLLAYWCFYHVGTASWITQGDYWSRMNLAAGSKEYPRCHERRHFRGENARKSVAFLERIGVDSLFQPLLNLSKSPLPEVMAYVQTWVGFGPWIAFKVADMLERLDLAEIRFDEGAMFLFDSPQEGAEMHWGVTVGGEPGEDVGSWAVQNILLHLGSLKAPPRYERLINSQEVETILCKWKSYRKGHYEIREDIKACRQGLLRFSKCPISQKLIQAGKKGGLW